LPASTTCAPFASTEKTGQARVVKADVLRQHDARNLDAAILNRIAELNVFVAKFAVANRDS
jgi:hypothetical protein